MGWKFVFVATASIVDGICFVDTETFRATRLSGGQAFRDRTFRLGTVCPSNGFVACFLLIGALQSRVKSSYHRSSQNPLLVLLMICVILYGSGGVTVSPVFWRFTSASPVCCVFYGVRQTEASVYKTSVCIMTRDVAAFSLKNAMSSAQSNFWLVTFVFDDQIGRKMNCFRKKRRMFLHCVRVRSGSCGYPRLSFDFVHNST